MDIITTTFKGYPATIIRPDHPNGKWIWKTEFLFAFDQVERSLVDEGYTRVCYHISNKYGSYRAVRLMHDFYQYFVKEYDLEPKGTMIGFSRGGLYAFNFALYYPEYVEKMYLDAPVLDMRDWPPADSEERQGVYEEYCLTPETIETFGGHPIENLEEYFALGIPTLLVAGDTDEIVSYEKNSGKMLDYCSQNQIPITAYVKKGCGHHPHSLSDVSPAVDFVVNDPVSVCRWMDEDEWSES